ncbi:MAG: hypothetical protein FWD36_00590 [Treponema sp.]|nr:hypothetical protein [Treponema sp.]
MKRITVLALTILLVPLCLTGCPNGDETKTTPANMTFVDDLVNPTLEFTIDENLGFQVAFIAFPDDPEKVEELEAMEITIGTVVYGKITDTNDQWTNTTITGTAKNMGSNTHLLNLILSNPYEPVAVDIELTYTKLFDEIITVTVYFPPEPPDPEADEDDISLSAISQALMGRDYIRK